MSTTAACWIGSSRPTAPKSISPSVPSSNAKTLPGCGSAWKKPRRSTWSSVERSSWSARPARSTAGASSCVDVGDREALEPLLHEQPAGAQVRGAPSGHAPGRRRRAERGHLDHRVGLAPEVELGPQALGELAEQVAGAEPLAERRAPLREVGEQRERGEVALHRRVDAGPLDLDDDALAGAQPGPVGLADRGRGERLPVELGEDVVDVAPSSASSTGRDALARLRRHPVLQLGQLGADVGRQEVDAGRGDLAELDVDAARLLEHPPQPDRLAVVERSTRLDACEERPEALAPGEADELAVAAEHGDAPAAPRASGAARRRGRRARRWPATRAGEQVEGDRDRHRGRDADGDEVHDEAVGAPVPVVEPERDDDRRCPSRARRRRSAVPHPRRMPSSRSDDES